MGTRKMERKVEDNTDLKKKYSKLKKEIEHHNKLYYQDNKPKISDVEYDGIWKQLKGNDLYKKNFGIIRKKETVVKQISKESFKNYYDREQAEEELMDMLQSNRLFKMKDTTLDFIKKLTGQSGNSFTIRETGKFLSNFINEFKIQYEIKE